MMMYRCEDLEAEYHSSGGGNRNSGLMDLEQALPPLENLNKDREFLLCLRQNCVIRDKFPPYLKCELCRMKLHVKIFDQHIQERKHKTKLNMFKEDVLTTCLPQPCQAQVEALTIMIEKYCRENMLTRDEIHARLKVIEGVGQKIKGWLPLRHFTLRPHGSTVSGFGLVSSDINVELQVENEENFNAQQVLQEVYNEIQLRPNDFFDVQREFDISSPRLSFTLASSSHGVDQPRFQISTHSTPNWQILAKYASFDERVAKLGACFKIWASHCGFDRTEKGFWPPHVFPIMVIHFLQHCSPPVLPSIYPEQVSDEVSLEELDRTYQEVKATWRSSNNSSIGQLWLEMFAYYAKDFKTESYVVNLRGQSLTIAKKEWSTCILAVEDPIYFKYNLGKNIGRKELYFNYHHNLVKTYHYFMTPRNIRGSLFDALTAFTMKLDASEPRSPDNTAEDSEEDERQASEGSDGDQDEPQTKTRMRKGELNSSYHMKLSKKFGIGFQLRPDREKPWERFNPRDFYYTLEIRHLPFFKPPMKYCVKCRKIDHYKNDCQSEKLPLLQQVPDHLSFEKASLLDYICKNLYSRLKLDARSERILEMVLLQLTDIVRQTYRNAELSLFGSSQNGFGAKNCDLDLCLTFSDNETGKDIDQTEIIINLAKVFKERKKSFLTVLPITQAKVPVLKLTYRIDGIGVFDCDISLYNLLARDNTRLLRTYCQIDSRVPVLGLVVKKFFKVCGICDASKGSLSSYAYTLMTLYYLQRCSPPVIPVLQELYNGEEPQRMVEGFNTWFFEDLGDDLQRLREKWPYLQTNKQSVGDLFYGFLKFYSELFNFDDLVICIRRNKNLTKMEKKWTGRRIAIEDPFLLTHNLGQGIDSEMARYIKASIVLGRNRIGRMPDELHPFYKSWEDYFFDHKFLVDGAFPKGRGCHHCNCIGHQIKDCPQLAKRKQRVSERNEAFRLLPASSPPTKADSSIPYEMAQGFNKVQQAYHNEMRPPSFRNQSFNQSPRQEGMSLLGNIQRQCNYLKAGNRPKKSPNSSSPQTPPNVNLLSNTSSNLNRYAQPQGNDERRINQRSNGSVPSHNSPSGSPRQTNHPNDSINTTRVPLARDLKHRPRNTLYQR